MANQAFGGYPKIVLESDIEEKKAYLNELINSFVKKDIYESRIDRFHTFGDREDKGQLLENYGFLRLQEKFEEQQVKFWRTADKREIDFIVSESYERGTISVTTAEISMILPRIIDQDEITRRLSVSGNSGYSSLLYRHSLLVTCH